MAQSLSPQLHGHWLSGHGVDGAYVPLAVRPEDFAVVLDGLGRAGFRGVNVTVPHKEAAFALAHRHDEAARATGAVNLLLFHGGEIEGRNTDVAGLTACLDEALGVDWVRGKTAAIWGAGGAARGAVYALSGMGAKEIRILSRNRRRAETLAAALAPAITARLVVSGFEDWAAAAADCALLVQATSAGMKGAPSIALPLDPLPPGCAVFDAVFNPLKTELLSRAEARGLRTVDGLGMLMHQAVPAFAAFFGIEPRVTPALRSALEKALAGG